MHIRQGSIAAESIP